MAGLDLLNLNLSVVYQFALFLLTLFVLSRWLIKPVTTTLALRRKRLVPVEEDSDLERGVKEKESEYADLLQNIRNDSTELRQKIREEAVGVERNVLDKAQDSANQRLQAGRGELLQSLETTRAEMVRWIPDQAKELARKIIGRDM